MGKRRVRNLLKHDQNDVIGFDVRSDRTKEAHSLYGIQTFENFDDAMTLSPDVFIISCPPDKHVEYANYAIDHKIHFFSEVNTELPEKFSSMPSKIKEQKIIGVPSCTMRFHPCVIQIKNILDENMLGKPLLLTFHSGENLEDWHPWEKISDYYVGDKKTGGGRDQIMFELEWVKWLMGNVQSVQATTTKLSKFDADIFDVYDLIVKFENGSVGNILVDVIQKPANRILRIVCENGVINWDWMNHMVKIYDEKNHIVKELPERDGYKGYLVEEMYEQEIKQLLMALNNEEVYPTSFENEISLLNIMYASEQSSESGSRILL